jgi:hypothetical protein
MFADTRSRQIEMLGSLHETASLDYLLKHFDAHQSIHAA